MATIFWRMVSRSSMNSTSLLATRTSIILWDIRTIFSRVSRIFPFFLSLPQDQFFVAGQLRFHFLEHFLIRDTGVSHLLLMLNQNLAGFLIDAVFDGNLFEHGLAEAQYDGFRRFGLHHLVFDQFFECFVGHVADQIAVQQHSLRVLYTVTEH